MGASDRRVIIYGAGGHGKVVLDALARSGREVAGFIDDVSSRSGGEHCGYPVYKDLSAAQLGEDAEIVVAIGDAAARQRITGRLMELGRALATAIHPSAVVARDVEIGRGAMILAQAAVNPGSRLGRGVIVNTGAIVDHDCVIGDFAHLAPGARLAGGVGVGDRALIGVGATVIPGVRIGADAVVGAGAVVIDDVASGSTVVGVPARPVSRPGERR